MLSIPHEMSFIPNLLRIYFNHVKNNTIIQEFIWGWISKNILS